MPLDASIYNQIKPFQAPSLTEAAQTAGTLSQLGMQQYQMAQLQATRQAFAANTGSDGNVDKQGVVSSLSRMGFGPQAMQLGQQFAAQDKARAEAQSAQADAAQKVVGVALPHLENLATVPDDQKPNVYHQMMSELADQGLPMHNVPAEFNQGWLDQTIAKIKNSPAYLAQQVQKSEIAKNQAEAHLAPVKLASEQFGSRSPNAEISSQYGQQAKPVQQSQINMQQMLDSYKNKTPQGDASLVLQNFKIRNPSVPDVNSIEEMKDSQAVSDTWKNKLAQAMAGGLDDNTRKNLIRDGISAFRGNVTSLRGIQQKFYQKAVNQNVPNAKDIVSEPAIDQTYQDAMDLLKQIGPYVPPAQRGGSILGSAAKMLGMGGSENATASDKPAATKYGAGSIVMVGGKHYTVGPDGDSLVPVKGKR